MLPEVELLENALLGWDVLIAERPGHGRAGWLCRHLWEHYTFTGDQEFLKNTAWPLMSSTAEFCLDWLVKNGTGHLVTAPSTSPELDFFTPDGQQAAVTMAATMDMAIR